MRLKNKNQRNQQLSDEELQRTQVLNLQDFKETARFERMTSKKPAILAASVGVLLIVLGLLFPTMQSLTTRQKVQARKIELEQEETKEKVKEEDMICHWQQLNNANGTDENIDITFHFKDDKLLSAKKEYKLTKSLTATETPAELASYLSALQSYLMQIGGYSVSVQTIDNGSITTTAIEYGIIDLTKVPDTHKTNYRFNITQKAGNTKEEVTTNMKQLGYECK